jgi:hypothetical protein
VPQGSLVLCAFCEVAIGAADAETEEQYKGNGNQKVSRCYSITFEFEMTSFVG